MTSPAARPVDSSQHSVDSIELTVNGEPRSIRSGVTVADLIDTLALNEQLVAVEVNRRIVPKSKFGSHALSSGDHVEIVEFVGGG